MTTINLREPAEQALKAMRCAVPTGTITLYEWDKAISDLAAALAQQAPPMSEQKRKDGKYKVLYRCQDCGHDQWITEIVAQGAIYTGGSANWCDACDNGLPVRVDPKQQSEPVEEPRGCSNTFGCRCPKHFAAQQAEPLTVERLRDALVASRIIPPAAVEDPDGYDDGVTLHRIEALHRRIT